MKLTCTTLLLLISFVGLSQNSVISLWPNGAPDAIENKEYIESYTHDALGDIRGIGKVSNPTITPFLANAEIANGTAVIICPGGGYSHLAIKKEGYKVAQWLNKLGISAFVLKYRMPTNQTMKDKSKGPLQDAQEAIRLVRRNAKKWNINTDKIGILGFSAGGHLASTLSTHYNDKVYTQEDNLSARPDFSVLIYPVVSMKNGTTHQGSRKNLIGENPSAELISWYSNASQITTETPPAFLVHATDDKAVPVENSIEYYTALKQNNIPVEMHIYENGGHGFGLGNSGTNTDWPKSLEKWFLEKNYIKNDTVYAFSYFKGNGEDGLHLAYSEDGYKWQSLKNDASFLTPKVGKDNLMRDPCIINGGDGNFHMVWTVSWTDKGIGYATSKDLISWSEQKFIPVMAHEPGTKNTWAPEINYDKTSNRYMIYWASTIEGRFPEPKSAKENKYNHRMYYTTTADFENFSDTKLLYEHGFNVIDATIKKVDDTYVMFLKDETVEPTQKNIKVAMSKNLEGPYSKPSEPITGDYWAEGPSAMNINGNWIVYFDKYKNHKYGAVSSSDLKTWEDISDEIKFPEGTRHGTIFKITRNQLKALKKN
ncbi:prolyl oligopeptidase family serine peptidase [Aurantibacter crassamenti]|nr:prolyl oligopeptidase family serine peptidase [Aurantibacter crassamenti]